MRLSQSRIPKENLKKKCFYLTSTSKVQRHVDDLPAAADSVETGVDILREGNLGRTADGFQAGTAVQSVATDTNRGAPRVAGGLDDAVEELLDGAGAALAPRLLGQGAEELRALVEEADNSGDFIDGETARRDIEEELEAYIASKRRQ